MSLTVALYDGQDEHTGDVNNGRAENKLVR